MSKNQLAKLIKSVRKNGFENPVIEYAMVNGKPFVMRGSNRIQAAKMVPSRRGELIFKEVPIEFGGYSSLDDVINAAVRATGRNPFE